MKTDWRMFIGVGGVLVGAALAVAYFTGMVGDSYWASLGIALIVTGMITLFRQFRYRTDDAYRTQKEIQRNDERVHFLVGRAWTWAGYIYVLAGSVGGLILRMIGKPVLASMANGSVCLLLVLYALIYWSLQRRY